MNRFRIPACAGLLALTLAPSSFASDLAPPGYRAPAYRAPVAVYAPNSWTGFYIGVNGGYGWGRSKWSTGAINDSFNVNGGLVGETFGYNLQTGVWVSGIEGDYNASWIKGSENSGGGVCSATGCETWNSWLGTVRGRLGYAFDRWLPYVTGGLALGGIKMSPNTGGSDVKTKAGWTIGGGVEYAFDGPWSAKLEYLYVDLGTAICGVSTCGTSTDVNLTTNIVRAGLNYRF